MLTCSSVRVHIGIRIARWRFVFNLRLPLRLRLAWEKSVELETTHVHALAETPVDGGFDGMEPVRRGSSEERFDTHVDEGGEGGSVDGHGSASCY